ncbi:hypothetical protein ACHWQZ_G007878 [Mnemiopsis leidyi]
MTVGQDEKDKDDHSKMVQLLRNGSMVEVRVDKIINGGFHVRVLSENEREHKENMESLHLSSEKEILQSQSLQEYAAYNFISLSHVDPDKVVGQLVLFKSRDKSFCRGLVEKRKDTDIPLYIIRNIDTKVAVINIPLTDIRLLPEKYGLKRWPPVTLKFQLSQVRPITLPIKDGMISNKKVDTNTWDAAAMNFIKREIKDSIVVCKIFGMNPVNGVYDVMMFKQRSLNDKAVCINKELIEKGFARQMEPNEKPTVPAPSKGPDYSSTRASISTANISVDPRRDTQHSPTRTNNTSVNSSPDYHRNRSPHRADCRLKTVGAREPTPEKNLVGIGGTKSKVNTFSFKRPDIPVPLILGCDDLTPVSSIESCNFNSKIKELYIKGRGSSHTNLSEIQRYGWPFFEKNRDGVLVFPRDNTLRTELTFLTPLLSTVANGTYHTLPRSYSPKVLIIAPSCEDVDLLVRYSQESLHESQKYGLYVRKAYTLSKFCPHADLWNKQDIVVITPDSLIKTHEEHIPADGKSIYYHSTCHMVLHKSHDLFTRHKESMFKILSAFREEREEQDYKHVCQITLFSDTWLPMYHAVISKFMDNPVIVIQNRTEAALFGGVTSHVEEFSNAATKRDSFITTTRKLCDRRKKTAVLVRTNPSDIVQMLRTKAVPCEELDERGFKLRHWTPGSAMVISDTVAKKYQVPDCDVVLHFDMAGGLAAFNNRLSFLESRFTGISAAQECLSIFFLTEDEDVQSVNNLVKYLSRHSVTVPKSLQDKADIGEKERQKGKADKPLCRYLRQYGSCTARACSMRHVVLESDAPGSSLKLLDLPLRGKIKVRISSVADGNRLYGRIMSVEPGKCPNAEEEFQKFSEKVQGWFNDKPALIDEDKLIHDLELGREVVVGVKDKMDGKYYRARVKSIRYNADRAGTLDGVIAHCLDTGCEGLYPLEQVYRFPARLAERPAFTTELIVCGIKPTENDLHFSSYCKKELVERVVGEELEGNIELTLGNTLWVRTLEKRQLLPNLKLMSSELSVKKIITDKMFGVFNEEHIKLLRTAVREALPDEVPDENMAVMTSRVSIAAETRHVVCVSHVDSPDKFYVNIVDNLDSLAAVEEQINNQKLLDSILPCWLPKHTFCIARYSKDERWYRGEILRTWHDKYHVHFVDYGNEDKAVPSNFVKTIPSHLLEYPFQAVRCKLADIVPIKDSWSSADQQIMMDVTDGEYFFLDLIQGPDGNNAHTVKLSYTDDGASLVDILCREPVGMNISHVTESAFSNLIHSLYKKNADKESNDYEMLCSAEKLESAITSPDSKISSSDLATLCRLTKIRSQDEEVLLHLIRSLTHVVSRRDEWSDDIIQETFLRALIDKLTSPSVLHSAIAELLSAVGYDRYVFHHCISDTNCIVSLCGLCVYKEDQTPKLLAVLGAIQTLATAVKRGEGEDEELRHSGYIRKEILASGHVRTLCKFVRESSDKCLEKVMVVLARIFEAEKVSGSRRVYRTFKEEGGVTDVCRATRRTHSTAVIGIVKTFDLDNKETLTTLKKEGLADWFKALKEKRRDFGTRIACDQFYKLISAHKIEEKDDLAIDEPPPPVMMRVPITTPIDQPIEVLSGIGLDSITREPTLLWYQRRKTVGLSVQVKDVGKYKMELREGRNLEFSTWNSGLLFKFEYCLFAEVQYMTHSANNSEVLVTLTKKIPIKWRGLLQNAAKKGTIKLDFSRAVDSDDETESEGETRPSPPPVLPPGENAEICIGEAPSSEEYLTEEEEIGDDYTTSFFNEINYNVDSDDMDALE